MGYNTFNSLPRLLPNREHIVLTHKDIKIDGVKIFNTFDELTNYLQNLNEDIYIIGGRSIYKLFLPLVDELLLTKIEAIDDRADVYFPDYQEEEFTETIIRENKENDIVYKHVRLERRKRNE